MVVPEDLNLGREFRAECLLRANLRLNSTLGWETLHMSEKCSLQASFCSISWNINSKILDGP